MLCDPMLCIAHQVEDLKSQLKATTTSCAPSSSEPHAKHEAAATALTAEQDSPLGGSLHAIAADSSPYSSCEPAAMLDRSKDEDTLVIELRDARGHIAKQLQQISDLEAAVAVAEAQLETPKSQLKSVQDELKTAQEGLAACRGELNASHAQLETLRTQLETARQALVQGGPSAAVEESRGDETVGEGELRQQLKAGSQARAALQEMASVAEGRLADREKELALALAKMQVMEQQLEASKVEVEAFKAAGNAAGLKQQVLRHAMPLYCSSLPGRSMQ